jgi:p-cumate 2,3-dioxygenase subunit beta
MTHSLDLPTPAEVEQLFYAEAALLDGWRLEEWLGMLTEDICYFVPATDRPDGNPNDTLFLIADDSVRLHSRVKQLSGKTAHAETPHSRTRRLITNVRVLGADGENIRVTANFVVYRMRYEAVDAYVGHYEFKLVRRNGELKIRERKAILDLEALRPHGKVSIIL